jgi:hypothetical protein
MHCVAVHDDLCCLHRTIDCLTHFTSHIPMHEAIPSPRLPASHHTIFFESCPVVHPSSSHPPLSLRMPPTIPITLACANTSPPLMPSRTLCIIIIPITPICCHQTLYPPLSWPCVSTTPISSTLHSSAHLSRMHATHCLTTTRLPYRTTNVTNICTNSVTNKYPQYHAPTYRTTTTCLPHRTNRVTNTFISLPTRRLPCETPLIYHTNRVTNKSLQNNTNHLSNTSNHVLCPAPVAGTFADPSGGCYSATIIPTLPPTFTHQFIMCTTSRHDCQLLMKSSSLTKREGNLSRHHFMVQICCQLVLMSLLFSLLIPP